MLTRMFCPHAGIRDQSYLGVTGVATSIGEQPLKGLINAASMARMTVAEALTNMVCSLAILVHTSATRTRNG